MFGCKAPTICNAWLRLTNYNDSFSQGKCAWVNHKYKLILAAKWWSLKRTKYTAEKSVSQAGGKALKIPLGNLLLLHYHLEGSNWIWNII